MNNNLGWKAVGNGALTGLMWGLGYTAKIESAGISQLSYAGQSVVTSTVNSFMPSMNVSIGNNFSVNASFGLGVGPNGLAAGFNFSGTYHDGDFSLTGGIGISENRVSWGTGLTYDGFGASYYRTRYGDAVGSNGSVAKTVIFAGDYERVIKNDTVTHLYYMEGGGIYVRQVKGASTLLREGRYYVHPDHLGSLTLITNAAGNVRQKCTFDAWGKRTFVTKDNTLVFDRGFTGHEHLDEFGLINMNGRMYDPIVGRFLSPDPYVQAPDFSQSFNRYSYALNNPLIYTDPTGEKLKWWHWGLIFLGADALTGGATSATALTAVTTGTTTAATTLGTAMVTAPVVSSTLSSVDFGVTFFGTLINGDPAWGGKRFENWLKFELSPIVSIAGMFDYDKSANGFEKFLQTVNTLGGGEYLQNHIGNGLGHLQNIGGYVDKVDYYKGRTIIRLTGDYIGHNQFEGISFGNYVFGNNIALNPNDAGYNLNLFAHEFGHTYQSKITGPLYLFKYGIPSAVFQGSSEDDANRRGFGNLGISQPTTGFYSRNANNPYKWWESGLAPILWPFMWLWNH
jgi:RHS repeat-associated protein